MSVITGPADAIQDIVEAIQITPALVCYRWIPREFDKIPCAVIEIPQGSRGSVEEPEMQFGSYTYRMTYKVSLIVDLDNPKESQEYLTSALEKFIEAIDENYTLNGEVEEAKVTSWDLLYEQATESRPLLGAVCDVEVLRLEQM